MEDTWVQELRDPDIFYAAVLPRDLLNHLSILCGGLHALDGLALQNDIQRFHLDAEGMPEYINALKDAQKQSRRANHNIANAVLLLLATNAMLATQRFQRANKRWEEKNFQAKTWPAWKTLYKEADHQAKTSRIAAGGKDQFGAAHDASSAGYAPPPAPAGGPPDTPTETLDEYFGALAAAATTKKSVLAELVKANATLTATNATLVASVTALTNALGAQAPTKPCGTGTPRPKHKCPNCKKDVFHKADDCFGLEKNMHKRFEGWVSGL